MSALGAISLQEPSLSSHISNILGLFCEDNDEEEVRHRAKYFIQLLEDVPAEKVESKSESGRSSRENELEMDHLDDLIGQLDAMMNEGVYEMDNVNLFCMEKTRKTVKSGQMTKTERIQQKHKKKEVTSTKEEVSNTGDKKVEEFLKTKLEDFGEILFTSPYQKLSEEDFEYFVKARKHVVKETVVVEFIIENNSENKIEKVQIKLDEELENLGLKCTIPNEAIEANESGSTFLVLEKGEKKLALDEIQGVLDFEVVILDEDTQEEVNR